MDLVSVLLHLFYRVSIHSLFYLRWQINDLLRKCHRPKLQVLCWSDCLDALPSKILHCLFKEPEDLEVDEASRRKALEMKLMRQMAQSEDGAKRVLPEGTSFSTLRFVQSSSVVLVDYYDIVISSVDFRGNHIHGYVRGIEEGCQIPAFPPGKIIHIQKRREGGHLGENITLQYSY